MKTFLEDIGDEEDPLVKRVAYEMDRAKTSAADSHVTTLRIQAKAAIKVIQAWKDRPEPPK